MTEFCDYCGGGLVFQLRAVGFTELEGTRKSLVKMWCGRCEVPNDIDPEADRAFRKAARAQTGAPR